MSKKKKQQKSEPKQEPKTPAQERRELEEMIGRINASGQPCVLVPSSENMWLLQERLKSRRVCSQGVLPFLRWAGSQGWGEVKAGVVLKNSGVEIPAWLIAQQLPYGEQGHGVPVLDEEEEWELEARFFSEN